MSDRLPDVPPARAPLSRRRFLQVSAAIGAAAATPVVVVKALDRLDAAGSAPQTLPGSTVPTPTVAPYEPAAGAVDTGLILVSLQLGGGNDGANTVVDHTSGRYRDLRRSLALDAGSLDLLDDRWGLYSMPTVAGRWRDGDLAIVHGLGYPDSSLSHFAATDVWLAGSTDPAEPAGWLGRGLTAAAGADADPLLGISIGGLTPSMLAPGFSPTSLPVGEEEMPWTPLDLEDHRHSSAAMRTLTAPEPADSELASAARAGQAAALAVGDQLGHIVDEQNAATERAYEELEASGADEAEIEAQLAVGTLTPQFDAVADLVNAGLPTRAYHVLQGGYDTHEGQADSHPTLLGGLDASLARFWDRLGPNADRVVVMTWSEFGRRPDFNGSGTDHGTASLGLVIGKAVQGGHYGEPTDLRRVDDEENWIPTVDFRRYLGGVAGSVLGVDPDAVADTGGSPITVI